jgi:hypothetical protein
MTLFAELLAAVTHEAALAALLRSRCMAGLPVADV